MELRKIINNPLIIGNRKIENRLFLAPMAGLGHIAFRELVEEYGGYGLLFTGMCSAKAVPHENRHISTVFKWRDKELNKLVCQLFGAEPDNMAKAAKRVEDEGFFGVDLNFGCSVAAICKKNCGAALLKDPDLAVKIVESIRKSVSIPIFIKFRTGWSDNPEPAVLLATRFENAGADALVFHPRVAPDRRSKTPRWKYITLIKKAVTIPVFGNGNLFDDNDCKQMFSMTNCDGFSLGRIAIAKPWIFSALADGFIPSIDIYLKCALKITTLLEKHYDPINALKLFKKFAVYFTANFSFGHSIYIQLCKANSMEETRDKIREIFSKQLAVLARPNMNMFV
ncbi:MAG: tRNA-dihydrouridine synthase [Desulfobacteraceae bacterium 4572_19]|nr:MAG: tRNA-dihydrouridine synthase [Desulfobacteraceae bacterium 4572_19]